MKHQKLIFISDTHWLYNRLTETIPEGDFLIHCGDISGRGWQSEVTEVTEFANWFSSFPHKYKIIVPGNHDFLFEKSPFIAKSILEARDIICLIDEFIEIEGVKFWGFPITPYFLNWAFNRFRGSSIKAHWDKIPEGIDVLITHGPPAYFPKLSAVLNGEDVGCKDLYRAVKRINPKIHCFGHIHEGYGVEKDDKTIYINCSLVDVNYVPRNKPIQAKYSRGKFTIVKSDSKRKQ